MKPISPGLPANSFVRERYVPIRASEGTHIPYESADYRPVHSPWDRKVIANVGFMSLEQAQESLSILVESKQSRRMPRTHERVAILKRAAQRVREKEREFADLIAWEGGKPLRDARAEVLRAVNSLELAASEGARMHGEEIPMRGTAASMGRMAFTYPEPIGVVFAISAFNHPLNLIAHQVAPAIAVGCPVLIKPASETPLSCLHLLDVLYESGLSPHLCLPMLAENDVSEQIARSSEISFLNFIGSAKVGWHLRSVAAPGVRVALEHGGSAPVIVTPDVDIDEILPGIVRGAFYHSGQVCVSIQRLFVHEKVIDEFMTKLVKSVKGLKTGDPRLETTDCGPIIRERDLERINSKVREAREKGAAIAIGGERLGETCFQPTVLMDTQDDWSIMREEIFGPVVSVNGYRELDEAIDRANNVPWSFQAAIYSKDLEAIARASRRLNASAVLVNENPSFRVDWMPFRGDAQSGLGTGGIPYAMREMTREKMVVIKSNNFSF